MFKNLTKTLRRALAIALTGLALHGTAQAGEATGYLFDLTESEISGLMDQYVGRGKYDRSAILARMRSPLDCRYHAELCADVGREYAYVVLEQMWAQARRGERVEVIRDDAAVLADTLAARYVELTYPDGIDPKATFFGVPASTTQCSQSVVFADSGNFRLRQSARAIDGGVAAAQWSRAEFNKKNSNGKYRAERADKLQVVARFFITGPIAPEVLERTKVESNSKRVTAFFPSADTGTLSNPHTEGCGTVFGPASLQACACSGPRPLEYQGL